LASAPTLLFTLGFAVIDPSIAVYRLVSDVAYRIIDGETVMIVSRTNRVLGFNGVASCVMPLLEQGSNVTHAAEAIVADYDVELNVASADVTEFFCELERRGVVERIADLSQGE
jgi:hypothetical protein